MEWSRQTRHEIHMKAWMTESHFLGVQRFLRGCAPVLGIFPFSPSPRTLPTSSLTFPSQARAKFHLRCCARRHRAVSSKRASRRVFQVCVIRCVPASPFHIPWGSLVWFSVTGAGPGRDSESFAATASDTASNLDFVSSFTVCPVSEHSVLPWFSLSDARACTLFAILSPAHPSRSFLPSAAFVARAGDDFACVHKQERRAGATCL
jgi:hypothetical protein